MDQFPIKLNLKLEIFISTAGKSIPNLARVESLEANYGKVWKVQPYKDGKFYISYIVSCPKKRTKFSNFTQRYFSYFSTRCNQTFQFYKFWDARFQLRISEPIMNFF